MATLERRVQVLFDDELYERLVAEAQAGRVSVGAFVRDAVEDRLGRRRTEAQAALKRLWERVDAQPPVGPIDWEEEKELMERSYLRDIP